MSDAKPSLQNASTDDCVPLLRARHEFEGESIVLLLREAGIDATRTPTALMDWLPSPSSIESPEGVLILVPRGQVDAARVALAEAKEAARDVNWSEIDFQVAEAADRSARGRMLGVLPRVSRFVLLIWIVLTLALAAVVILLLPW